MAVLDGIEGLQLSIAINGKPLTEYGNLEEVHQSNTVTRYIEATTDASFEIFVNFKGNYCYQDLPVAYHMSLDGHHEKRNVQTVDELKGGKFVAVRSLPTRTIEGHKMREMRHSLIFSPLPTGMQISCSSRLP